MVLVDTSVWIRFYAGREPYVRALKELLSRSDAATHDMVYGELLIGDIGGGRNLLVAFQHIPYVPTVSHGLVVALVQDYKLHGRGVGWIDVHLLASALAGGVKLWTADAALRELAAEFGVAYHPS
jgi:predicted nucleic acid-binding protein